MNIEHVFVSRQGDLTVKSLQTMEQSFHAISLCASILFFAFTFSQFWCASASPSHSQLRLETASVYLTSVSNESTAESLADGNIRISLENNSIFTKNIYRQMSGELYAATNVKVPVEEYDRVNGSHSELNDAFQVTEQAATGKLRLGVLTPKARRSGTNVTV